MAAFLLTAWPQGLPTQGSYDLAPVIWTGILLLAAWAVGRRLRWWGAATAPVGGVLCATLAAHFGLWAPVAATFVSLFVLRPREMRQS